MIKVNVKVNSKSWHKKIKNPKKYFNKKLKKISKIVKFFKGKNMFTDMVIISVYIKLNTIYIIIMLNMSAC